MSKAKHYIQLIVFDSLAALCILGALLTGWLPGPGGIPLFLAGLGLLAINHDWAQRYIDLLKEYGDKLGDLVFIPRLRLFFDILTPILATLGVFLLVNYQTFWTIPIGIFFLGMSLVIFLGNRKRLTKFKGKMKRKH